MLENVLILVIGMLLVREELRGVEDLQKRLKIYMMLCTIIMKEEQYCFVRELVGRKKFQIMSRQLFFLILLIIQMY
jgi:hypothetical protein